MIIFRETNLDTVTTITATNMQRRGVCLEHETDYGGNHTFLFAENPGDAASCYYCVRLYIRTVNILEKIESEFETGIASKAILTESICLQLAV